MKVDCLLIGQGICGTFLSWYLEKAGLSFLVIDESQPNTASKAAAGVINPITGRRMVKTWMIDELLPFAWNEYQLIGAALNLDCIAPKNIIEFFPTPQMRLSFIKRFEEDRQHLYMPVDEKSWDSWFHYPFGWGEIQSCYLVDLGALLPSFRNKLINQHKLLEQRFVPAELIIKENGVQYKEINADKIIFCDGIQSFHNPFFKNLPFAPNKGEALIAEIKDLPGHHIYKKGINMVPLKDNLFWIGSSYEWEFEHDRPTEAFRKRTEAFLREWLKLPFNVLEHLAAIRPATLERRPFVGFHPAQQNVGILNGMGTKGCSLAPFFANQLVQHLSRRVAIDPEANVSRFAKILGRSS
jgi:glycine/D-amino acid oxidase-like deaminating enzyme